MNVNAGLLHQKKQKKQLKNSKSTYEQMDYFSKIHLKD